MTRAIIIVVALLFAGAIGCGGDADNGGARGDLLDEAAAAAEAADDASCTQDLRASGESRIDAIQFCNSDGNRVDSDGQTGDNSTDRHDTTDSGHNTTTS